jgi:hypothetical protein
MHHNDLANFINNEDDGGADIQPLQKEQFGVMDEGRPKNTLHGWISPEGQYHHMMPRQVHNAVLKQLLPPEKRAKDDYDLDYDPSKEYKEGWISVGHGGENSIRGHADILSDHTHPATKALRKLAGKHWGGNNMEICAYRDYNPDQYGDRYTVHSKLNTDLFSKHGLHAALKDSARFNKTDE